MLSLILFLLYSNDLLNIILRHRKHASREVLLIQKNIIYKEIVICKEKAGIVTEVKLVTKIKKHNQLYFGTLVSLLYCRYNAWFADFFQNSVFKESNNMALKKSQSNGKL